MSQGWILWLQYSIQQLVHRWFEKKLPPRKLRIIIVNTLTQDESRAYSKDSDSERVFDRRLKSPNSWLRQVSTCFRKFIVIYVYGCALTRAERDIYGYETWSRDYQTGRNRTVAYEHLPSQFGDSLTIKLPKDSVKNSTNPKGQKLVLRTI